MVLISFSVFAQGKKDTIAAKKKHIFSISILNELNYSNDQRIFFKDNSWEHSDYSHFYGATINWTLNKFFSIGTGLIIDQFSIIYYTGYPTNQFQQQEFYFINFLPIIPDFFYRWKRVSFHFIPEMRVDLFAGVKTGSMGFNNNILLLACPKVGVTYNISNVFSLSAYFGIKYSLAQMTNTNYNSRWWGDKLAIYSLTSGLGLNFKL